MPENTPSENTVSGEIPQKAAHEEILQKTGHEEFSQKAEPEELPEDQLPDPAAKEAKISKALHIPPKDPSFSEKIKMLYKKLEEASPRLEKLEQKIPSKDAIVEKETADKARPQTHASRLSSTLKFMDSVNNVFPFIQLPVKLKDENARGDLYVYEKKKAFKPGDTVSALLHLDLENLGSTDILVKLTGQNVAMTISAEREESKEAFSDEIPSLTDALSKKGYSLNCEIRIAENKEENAPLLTQFLEAHSPSLVSRFSFDMRA